MSPLMHTLESHRATRTGILSYVEGGDMRAGVVEAVGRARALGYRVAEVHLNPADIAKLGDGLPAQIGKGTVQPGHVFVVLEV